MLVAAYFLSRKRSPIFRLVLVCFGIYLILLIGTLFFPILVPGNWPDNLSTSEMRSALQQINLIPFHNTGILDSEPLSGSGILDIFANLLMTIPMGMAIPYLTSMRARFVILLAVVFGLLFEGVELIVKLFTGTFYHTVDINDVLMNTLGVLTGYIIFCILRWTSWKLHI